MANKNSNLHTAKRERKMMSSTHNSLTLKRNYVTTRSSSETRLSTAIVTMQDKATFSSSSH